MSLDGEYEQVRWRGFESRLSATRPRRARSHAA